MELSSLIFFLYFRRELSNLKNKKKIAQKKVIIFSKKTNFSYISGNRTFLYFLKKSFSFISRNGTF